MPGLARLRRPAAEQKPAARDLRARGEGLPAEGRRRTAARGDGHRQDVHDGAGHREGQRPTLVIAHNKTLAAQLCKEFRELFPDERRRVLRLATTTTTSPRRTCRRRTRYIEKDSSINDDIDRLRHAATAALFARRDVVIVASVTCIYGLGSPDELRRAAGATLRWARRTPREADPEQAGRHPLPAKRRIWAAAGSGFAAT